VLATVVWGTSTFKFVGVACNTGKVKSPRLPFQLGYQNYSTAGGATAFRRVGCPRAGKNRKPRAGPSVLLVNME